MVLPYTTDDLINARKLIDAGPRGQALILGTYILRGVQIQYQVIAVHRQRVAAVVLGGAQIRLYPKTLPRQKLMGNSVEHNRGFVRSFVISSDRDRMTRFHLTNVSTTFGS